MVGRRGMGIVGVAATAKVVSNRTQAKADAEREAQAAAAAPAAPAAAPAAPAAAAPAAGDDMVAQLQKLADLKAAGVLSDEEFAAAKAKVLAGS
jgi:Short C-terminal domain